MNKVFQSIQNVWLLSNLLSTCYHYIFLHQVFVHNPHTRAVRSGRASEISLDSDISLLGINQKVSAIAAGSLDGMGVSDILMVGTQTNILAYDVQNNTDIFYNDVSMIRILY